MSGVTPFCKRIRGEIETMSDFFRRPKKLASNNIEYLILDVNSYFC